MVLALAFRPSYVATATREFEGNSLSDGHKRRQGFTMKADG